MTENVLNVNESYLSQVNLSPGNVFRCYAQHN